MKPIVAGLLASLTALTLLPACGSDNKAASPSDSTVAGSVSPNAATNVPGSSAANGSVPTDLTLPAQVIDTMIAQFEAAGMKVDKACFTALLSDPATRQLITAAGATPNPDLIKKFFGCLST
ncbi:MAG: hypothetical protein ABI949_00885 [Ilumatobacteraceae bacterium]